jgi:hypothetical protein
MDGSLIGAELGAGAAVLAVWAEARIGERRPTSLRARMVHTGAAFVLLQASSAALAHLIHEDTTPRMSTALVFVFFLPALTYAFLAAMWLLRTLKDVLA